MGKPITTKPTNTPSLEAILAEVDKHLDTKLDKRLFEFERRLLAEIRQEDRQPPPEENRQVPPETRPEDRPDYQAVRDRILRSLTTVRGRIAPSAPQYKSAVKLLNRFIAEIQGDTKTPPGDST